jgi:type III secretion system YscI/HrpB-like protein
MTDLSGIQQAVQKISEQAADQGKGALDKGTASAQDVQKLQDAMKQNQPSEASAANGPQQAQGVEQTQGADKVGGVQQSTNESPGAKILNHMNGMRTGLQEAVAGLQSTLANPNAGPADLLKIQMQMQQVTMQQDLMGKVVSKSEQNIDQLLKGQ